MEEKENKLLPCPFCGGEATLDFDHEEKSGGGLRTIHHINCENDNCPVEYCGAYNDTELEAIKAWNTRINNNE